MKNIYVILAFHAHELLWDLPKILLSNLDDNNPMKKTFLDENYILKRKEDNRDLYSQCGKLGDILKIPLCVEYSNELLSQIMQIMPNTFEKLKADYKRGRLYPLYGYAHHTHVSLLMKEEITQEIQWNMQYLHNYMQVPYPKYKGLFPSEASFSYDKIEGIEQANIDYVIFPHLDENKVPFELKGGGDFKYKPFVIKTPRRDIIAFPRNFSISQEIWRPITKMKRDEVKSQGYILGKFPVFKEEYFCNAMERFPINMREGVDMYKEVLWQELDNAPDNAVLVYIQDLELMDFGDIALKIIEKAWQEIRNEIKEKYNLYFIIPDEYIDKVISIEGLKKLPRLKFGEINWAPEIRSILRLDGHYPPLGVTGVGKYDLEKTGMYNKPHILWENGKYYCGIFDTIVKNFNIYQNVPITGMWLNNLNQELQRCNIDVQVILFLRIMKRACNWGWRPTEGRQKLPYLKGYLICSALLKRLKESPPGLTLNFKPKSIDPRNIVGMLETLNMFIDNRIKYLKYGMGCLADEKNIDLREAYDEITSVYEWKELAVEKALELFYINQSDMLFKDKMTVILSLLQGYSKAVFMSTEHIQRIWSLVPDVEFMVEKMYEYLYDIYPPFFPSMIERIDNMKEKEVENYFANIKKARLIPR